MTLYWYILRDYFKFVVGASSLTVFLFILFDFIHKASGYFPKYNPTAHEIISYYFYQLPAQTVQALPIASLLGSAITMVLLSRSNEITAMRAVGMGPVRMAVPLAIGGIVISVGSLLVTEYLVPPSAKKMHYVKAVLIEDKNDGGLSESAQWYRNDQTIVTFKEYDAITRTLSGIKVFELRSNFRPKLSIEAEYATYRESEGDWRLENIKKFYFKRSGVVERVAAESSMVLPLPIEPSKMKKERREASELSLKELYELVDKGEEVGVDVLPFKVEFHFKFAYQFAALVVSFVGLRFAYKSERATETARGVLLAFAIGTSYWFILSACRALGSRGDFSPFIAAWMANFIVLGITFFDAWHSRQGR